MHHTYYHQKLLFFFPFSFPFLSFLPFFLLLSPPFYFRIKGHGEAKWRGWMVRVGPAEVRDGERKVLRSVAGPIGRWDRWHIGQWEKKWVRKASFLTVRGEGCYKQEKQWLEGLCDVGLELEVLLYSRYIDSCRNKYRCKGMCVHLYTDIS